MSKKCVVSVVVAAEGGHFEGQCSRTDVDNRFNDRVAVVRTGGAAKGLTVMVPRGQVRVVQPATSAMNNGGAA